MMNYRNFAMGAFALIALVQLGGCGGEEGQTSVEPEPESTSLESIQATLSTSDRVPPRLSLYGDAALGSLTVNKASVTVTGLATDNFRVGKVSWSSGSGASGAAVLSTTGKQVNWSADIPLVFGPNQIRFSVTDYFGNVAALALAVTSTLSAPQNVPVVEPSSGTTFHVRVDGGSAVQCNGKLNVAYPGTGTGLACAWNGPMVALPPSGTARIAGGDTLIIHAGQYMVGLGAPGADGCTSLWPWDCVMAAVPSGPDASRPTRILGEGHDASCPAAPQLWGTERASQVLSLKGTSNAVVGCLEITDHSSCVAFHSGSLRCQRDTYPYGSWSPTGLYAVDSSNVTIKDMNIHGMAVAGVLAGRLKDWNVSNLRVAGNGWVGWNGDLGADSANSGTMRFSRWLVEWNGCAETYPGNQPTGCWAQEAGGYGDGVGTAKTGGDWIIEDSTFRFNTSDGLDLLYHTAGGTVTLNRVWAEGNAGNQVKVAGNTNVTNTVVIGTCGFFSGKDFSFKVDHCRAAGDALALSTVAATDVINLINSTVVSEGNVALLTGGPAGSVLRMRNNVIVGLPYFLAPAQLSADTYSVGPGLAIDETHSVKQNLRNAKCTSPLTTCTSAQVINSTNRQAVDVRLPAVSAARDSGLAAGGLVPAIDYYSKPRPAGGGVDRGAVEMQ